MSMCKSHEKVAYMSFAVLQIAQCFFKETRQRNIDVYINVL